jgi:signal transduction histidine kinase
MTAAKGFVDMLTMVGPANEKQEQFIGKILTSIMDMTNLVEKVLDAGRLDPDMPVYEIKRETSDPSAIVTKVVSTLSNTAEQKEIKLDAKVANNVPIMNLDEMMIERALLNLVENAIKYTPEGGEVLAECKIEGEDLIFAVHDNGLGISPEDQSRLFERGERIRRQEHKRIRGSGLGLFIVANVARKHGGDAWVESELDKGSSFFISIPLSRNNAFGGGE